MALSVAALVSAGVIISAKAAERGALNAASLALQADFRYARRMAMLEGRRWGVYFVEGGDTYYVFHSSPRAVVKTVSLPDGVTVVGLSEQEMVYLPRGTALHGFGVVLGKNGYTQRLTATVSGGRVEIKGIVKTDGGGAPLIWD